MQCVEGKSEWNKQYTVPNICQNRRPYRIQTLFQFPAFSSPFLGTTENATFVHFIKKSMNLKTEFLLDYQVYFLLLNGPQIEKICSLIDRFMTSKGSDTLILPFTSKTGQPVWAKQTKNFFIWVLLVNRGHILEFYRPKILPLISFAEMTLRSKKVYCPSDWDFKILVQGTHPLNSLCLCV